MADLTGQNIQDTYQRLLQVSSSGQVTDGTGSILPIKFNGPDLIVSGAVRAQSYIISQSILNISSGSTAFGDTSDDSHTFLGSITASGNISASGAVWGDQFVGADKIFPDFLTNAQAQISANAFGVTINQGLTVNNGAVGEVGHITASGNISSSGKLISNIHQFNTDNDYIKYANNSIVLKSSDLSFSIAGDTNITASGNISSSGDILSDGIRSFTSLIGSHIPSLDPAIFQVGGDSFLNGNITASRNIQAGGYISASGVITALSSNIVTIDGGTW